MGFGSMSSNAPSKYCGKTGCGLYQVCDQRWKAYLELCFGLYAMDQLPEDDQFINSDKSLCEVPCPSQR